MNGNGVGNENMAPGNEVWKRQKRFKYFVDKLTISVINNRERGDVIPEN